MARREIVKWGTPVLHEPSAPVQRVDDEVRALLVDMVETMYAAPGIGLAAPQIGVPLRVIVIDLSVGEDKRQLIQLVNPEFLERVGMPEEQRNSRSAIEDPDGIGPRLFFQQVPEDKVAKNRVHLDVRAAPGLQGGDRMAALEAESERLVALGATRVARHEPAPPMEAGHLVMRDPEGNEFCLD